MNTLQSDSIRVIPTDSDMRYHVMLQFCIEIYANTNSTSLNHLNARKSRMFQFFIEWVNGLYPYLLLK